MRYAGWQSPAQEEWSQCFKQEVWMPRRSTGRDRIFEGGVFYGTNVVYAACRDAVTSFACDVELRTLEESSVKELRAYRQHQRARGKTVRSLRDDALHDELFVVFGPELSAQKATEFLQRLIEDIRANGLLTGRRRANGDFYVETLKGEVIGP
jgi:hypothetical protein